MDSLMLYNPLHACAVAAAAERARQLVAALASRGVHADAQPGAATVLVSVCHGLVVTVAHDRIHWQPPPDARGHRRAAARYTSVDDAATALAHDRARLNRPVKVGEDAHATPAR
ncbi:hypothetical protein DP939_44280 [Spongiactinospora rosea]|uniref:Uncharacterized protein n=1 Tax=Spongiactinospora rosea TaxID=2248750 RepID=A0A366LE76_9ACTN|nr:hypothetical protein [Spongiactinospora rosea]RBQ12166.1 hypothetical protein DP939_44280 [Spongiactinospora rosea]